MLLSVENLEVRYGRTRAVQGVSLELDAGEIVAVLGANGAGKSSLLRAIQGMTRPAGGAVRWHGEDITHWSAPRRVAAGLVLVPEGRQIFVSLTVHDNLLLGGHTRRGNLDTLFYQPENCVGLRQVLTGCSQLLPDKGRRVNPQNVHSKVSVEEDGVKHGDKDLRVIIIEVPLVVMKYGHHPFVAFGNKRKIAR